MAFRGGCERRAKKAISNRPIAVQATDAIAEASIIVCQVRVSCLPTIEARYHRCEEYAAVAGPA